MTAESNETVGVPSGPLTSSMFGEVKVPVPTTVVTLRFLASPVRPPVSRVTTSKFVETPQGVLPLKFFFHSGIAKTQGDEVSSISVKKMIEDLVAKEDIAKPLSDQDITRALRQEGLTIARRTVAKYREELAILPSHQRRLAVRKRT